MTTLSFQEYEGRPNGTGDVCSKLQSGLDTCVALLDLETTVARALRDFSLTLKDAIKKSDDALKNTKERSQGEMPGVTHAWHALLTSVKTIVHSSDKLSVTLDQHAVPPLRNAERSLRAATADVGASSSRGPPTGASGGGEDRTRKRVKRANDRLSLAVQELAESEVAIQEVKDRFGGNLNADLESAMKQRRQRAEEMKVLAEQQLRELENASIEDVQGPSKSAQGLVKEMDNLERNRLSALDTTFSTAARGLFDFTSRTSAATSETVETAQDFLPSYEFDSYLNTQLDKKVDLGTTRNAEKAKRQQIVSRAEMEKVGGAKEGQLAKAKDEVRRLERKVADLEAENQAVKQNNEELQRREKEAKREAVKSKREKKGTPQSPSAASEFRRSKSGKALGGLQAGSVFQQSSFDEQAGKTGQSPRSIPASTENQSQHSNIQSQREQLSQQQSHVDFDEDLADFDDFRNRAMKEQQDRAMEKQQSDVFIDHEYENEAIQDAATFKPVPPPPNERGYDLTDYVPPLHDILRIPLKPGLGTAENLIEIQRRFEEFLLTLRNLDLSPCIRGGSWGRDDFYLGIEAEEGFELYNIKAPVCSKFDCAKYRVEAAVEWGTRRMDDTQWMLAAYESLLLCLGVFDHFMLIHELIDMPKRDIMLIDPDATVNQPTGGLANTKARDDIALADQQRHRKQSLKSSGTQRRPILDLDPGEDIDAELPELLLETTHALVKKVVGIAKVTFGISGRVNQLLTHLTVPVGSNLILTRCRINLHPLDVRYRVGLLLETWVNADLPASADTLDSKLATNKDAKDWIMRQIHIVHTSIDFKLHRLSKFLPQYQGMYQWMHENPVRGIWYRSVAARLPLFAAADNETLGGNLWPLLGIVEYCLGILTGLQRAVDQDMWGLDITQENAIELLSDRGYQLTSTDMLRNQESIHNLILGMTAMSKLDKIVRERIARETADMMSGGYAALLSVESLGIEDFEEMENLSKQEVKEILATVDQSIQMLDCYWAYETPLLMTLLSYVWRTAVDPSSPDRMRYEAQDVAQGILIVSHLMQHGYDVGQFDDLPVSISLLTFDTVAILFVQSLWWSLSEAPDGAAWDDFDTDRHGAGAKNRPLKVDNLKVMYQAVSNFPRWLSLTRKEQDKTGSANPTTGAAEPVASAAHDNECIDTIKLDRIVDNTPLDSWESLSRPVGELRISTDEWTDDYLPEAEEGRQLYRVFNDPDFFLVDVTTLDENMGPGQFYQALDMIRSEPEGISLTMPSRVERVMAEMLLRRVLSNNCRNSMLETLCDYRLRLDPDALQLMLKLWMKINNLMFISSNDATPEAPNIADFYNMKSLPAWLSGPSPQYDLFRYFIRCSITAMYKRLFDSALQETSSPAWVDLTELGDDDDTKEDTLNAVGEVIKKIGEALKKFLVELRGELEFFPSAWSKMLPGNQHPVIVMYSARKVLIAGMQRMIDTGFWMADDVPPYGDTVLDGIAQFDRLCREVVLLTGVTDVLTKPCLLEILGSGITNALMKRFKNVEEILTRCMKAETWMPLQPPAQLHSVAMVDLFAFTNAIFDAVCELHAPLVTVLPSFLQFLGRLSQDYADFVALSGKDPALMNIKAMADSVFSNLLQPLPQVYDEQDTDHEKKKKGGIMGIFGGKKKADTAKKGAHVGAGEAEGATKSGAVNAAVFFDDLDLHPGAGNPKVKDAVQGRHIGGASDLEQTQANYDQDFQDASNQTRRAPKVRKKGKNDPADETPPEVEELKKRVGKDLAQLLYNLSKSFAAIPLPTMCVKLYNLMYFCEQLPQLARKFLRMAIDQAEKRDPHYETIANAMDTAMNRKTVRERDITTVEGYGIETSELHRMQEVLQEVIVQCRQHLLLKARDVCSCISLRIVYYDLGPDIFGDMYPDNDFASQTFSSIVLNLNSTVLKFVNQCPQIFQQDVLSAIVQDLAKAWCLLLSQIGYEGHVFYEEQISVLDQDLSLLEDFAERNNLEQEVEIFPYEEKEQQKGLLRKLRGQNEVDQQEATVVNMFEHINDFIVMLSQEPYMLAQLGGTFDPGKERKRLEKKAKEAAAATERGGGEAVDVNLFENFNAEDGITSSQLSGRGKSKKKKGFLGGVLKFK